MCPSASIENEYRPSESPIGRDSIRDRFTPRTPNCSSMASSAPASLSGRCTTRVVLSAPVRAGTSPGCPTTTNRVCADGLSAMSCASGTSPYDDTAAGGTRAASKPSGVSPEAIRAAGAVFDVAGTCTAPGRCAASHRRHCTHACGCAEIRRTSASATPGAAASVNCTGTSTSCRITSGAPTARLSSVAVTPPSTVLSIATTA